MASSTMYKTLLIGLGATVSTSAMAQTMAPDEAASLRAEVSGLKAQLQVLESRLNQLSQTAPVPSSVPLATPPERVAEASRPDYKVIWKGAPEISTPNGWSFKPRGRIQFDSGLVSVAALPVPFEASTGIATEMRRAYLGAQGTIPGGFGYRFDIDFAPGSPEFTDTYLTWDRKALNVTLGQHYPFLSLDQQTSDLDTSFLERTAFNSAFNFERRVGLSFGYTLGNLQANAGVFTDNLADLSSDANNSYSFDGRLIWMPKFAGAQFHLAGSLHWRDQNDQSTVSVRYRSRPYTHTTDLRFIDTRALGVGTELNYGLEAAAVRGPFHVAAEANWMRPTLLTGLKPTFFGGYAEVGYFITGGDTRPYKKGAWGAIKPARGLDNGGAGAIQFNMRYDRLDLGDAGILGGTQDSYLASVIWTPVEHLRFMANYGHLVFTDAAIAAGTDRNYSADIFAARAQVDF